MIRANIDLLDYGISSKLNTYRISYEHVKIGGGKSTIPRFFSGCSRYLI